MKKQEIKNILMSMRTQENDSIINNLLGKIDLMYEKSLQTALEKIGNNEEGVRKFFEGSLFEKYYNQNQEKYPINDMFYLWNIWKLYSSSFTCQFTSNII